MQVPNVAKKVWNIFTTVIVVLVVIFAVLLIGVRLFGVQVYSVISGSMEPEYPVGSLIYVKDINPSEIEVNDVITYAIAGTSVMFWHRCLSRDVKIIVVAKPRKKTIISKISPVRFSIVSLHFTRQKKDLQRDKKSGTADVSAEPRLMFLITNLFILICKAVDVKRQNTTK